MIKIDDNNITIIGDRDVIMDEACELIEAICHYIKDTREKE